MLYALRGFGEEASILSHGLVPEKATARSVYLRLVDTDREAKNYAINAFHTSVIRGQAGGCKDPIWAEGATVPFANGGLDLTATCQWPLNRQDIRDAWAAKAAAYLKAVQAFRDGRPWTEVKAALAQANALQPSPYALEKVDPPRDPGPTDAPMPVALPEPTYVGPKRTGLKLALGATALAGAVFTFAAIMEKRRKRKW